MVIRWLKGLLPYPRQSSGNIQGFETHGTQILINLPWLDALSEDDDLPINNSIVMSCLGWIMDVWPEAPFAVYEMDDDTPLDKHNLTAFLRRPNKSYSDLSLWMATTLSLKLDGNAYWYKVRGGKSNTGKIAELQYLPHFLVEPKSNSGGGFIDYFEYSPGAEKIPIPAEDIIHFRDGIDPWNVRKGLSRFKSLLREIATDDEAARYSHSIMGNMGAGATIIQPDVSLFKDKIAPVISKDEADQIADTFYRKTTGNNRGKPVVNSIPLKIDRLSWSPSEINMRETRRIPEERVCAVFGVPPGVVGLGAGLDRNTYNNAQTDEEKAYRRGILPLHRLISDAIDQQLLPEFGNTEKERTGFDTRNVSALQEDEDTRAVRFALLVNSNIITREQAQKELGYENMEGMYQWEWMRSSEPANNVDTLPVKRKRVTKAMRRDEIEELVKEFRARLMAFEESAIHALLASYDTAEHQIKAKLKALVEKIEQAQASGEMVTQSWLIQEKRYTDLLKQIDTQMALLSVQGSQRLTADQRSMIELALTSSEQLSLSANVVANWNPLNVSALEKFIGKASDGSALARLFDDLGDDFAKRARSIIGSGIVQGINPREVAKQVEDAFVGTRHRAETITRTEMLGAYREATRESFQQNGVNRWVWLSAADGRTCAACWAMHGEVMQSSEKLDGHPQCRCAIVPFNETLGIPAGKDLFKTLPDDQQREVLGAGGFDLYKNGDVDLGDFVERTTDSRWGTMRRTATLDEAARNARTRI